MSGASGGGADDPRGDPGATSRDAFLGGRLVVEQPRRGYRAAMDPVLLAAAVPAVNDCGRQAGGPVLDLGCGVGTAALCYAARVPHARVVGLERDPAMADLARANVAANALSDRVAVETGDLLAPPAEVALGPAGKAVRWGEFAQAMANPPYGAAAAFDPSPHPQRAAATVEGEATLDAWVAALLAAVRPKGGVTLIHRADRLPEILAALAGRAGEVAVLPLWPRAGQPAKRVVVHARKGVKGAARLLPGLVLHGAAASDGAEADGAEAEKEGQRYTEAAETILRDGAALPLE